MKFDVVVGNPPYNNGHTQIYPLFYLSAQNYCSQMSMIFPSGWQDPKIMNGLGVMNKPEVKRDKQIICIDNCHNIFLSTPGAAKINIIYWKKGYDNGLCGKQMVYTDGEDPKEVMLPITKYDMNIAPEILKLKECLGYFVGMDTMDMCRSINNLRTDYFKNYDKYGLPAPTLEKQSDDDFVVYGLYDSKRTLRYVNRKYVKIRKNKINRIDKYKVFIPKGWGDFNGQYKEYGGSYGDIIIGTPCTIATETFLECGCYDDIMKAKKMAKYLMSRFARALLLCYKLNQNMSSKSFTSVPVQRFTEDFWNSDNIDDIDEGLFDKYDVPEDIREFVRKNIQKKNIDNILGYLK